MMMFYWGIVYKRRGKKFKQYKEIKNLKQKERRRQSFYKGKKGNQQIKEHYRQDPIKLMEKVLNLESYYFDSSPSYQYAIKKTTSICAGMSPSLLNK